MKKTPVNKDNTAKPLTKRSIFDKIQSRSAKQSADRISTKKQKGDTKMSKNQKTPTTPKQPKDWARIRETAKTIAITALATAILAFAAGIYYEKQNTASIKASMTSATVAEAEPQSKQ